MKNLFKPFMQGDTSLDRGNGGLGLGLALVKGLAELHGGSVSADSGGLGQGSVFTVCLPRAAEQFPAAVRDPGPPMPYRSRRILVIDDIRDVADALQSLLMAEGHEVMVAYDGAEGIAVAKKWAPDILLCDIGLPGMSGYQVAQAFRADEELKQVFLISLTGYARPEDKKKAEKAGFQLQLAKPVDPQKLRETLTLYDNPWLS